VVVDEEEVQIPSTSTSSSVAVVEKEIIEDYKKFKEEAKKKAKEAFEVREAELQEKDVIHAGRA